MKLIEEKEVIETLIVTASTGKGDAEWLASEMKGSEELQKIASEICENYCKYPDQWDEEAEGCELSESEICKKCPLIKLQGEG